VKCRNPKCGADVKSKVDDPVKCPRCWWPYKLVGGERAGMDVDDAGAKTGGVGDGGSLSVLRKAKGNKKKLYPLQPLRSELGDGRDGGHLERPPIESNADDHADCRKVPAGGKTYCFTHKVYV
jgi:hypothetical protein